MRINGNVFFKMFNGEVKVSGRERLLQVSILDVVFLFDSQGISVYKVMTEDDTLNILYDELEVIGRIDVFESFQLIQSENNDYISVEWLERPILKMSVLDDNSFFVIPVEGGSDNGSN